MLNYICIFILFFLLFICFIPTKKIDNFINKKYNDKKKISLDFNPVVSNLPNLVLYLFNNKY